MSWDFLVNNICPIINRHANSDLFRFVFDYHEQIFYDIREVTNDHSTWPRLYSLVKSIEKNITATSLSFVKRRSGLSVSAWMSSVDKECHFFSMMPRSRDLKIWVRISSIISMTWNRISRNFNKKRKHWRSECLVLIDISDSDCRFSFSSMSKDCPCHHHEVSSLIQDILNAIHDSLRWLAKKYDDPFWYKNHHSRQNRH